MNFVCKNGCKGHQRSNLQWHYRFHKEYYLCGKFHNCFTKCTKCPIFCTMPLYLYRLHGPNASYMATKLSTRAAIACDCCITIMIMRLIACCVFQGKFHIFQLYFQNEFAGCTCTYTTSSLQIILWNK